MVPVSLLKAVNSLDDDSRAELFMYLESTFEPDPIPSAEEQHLIASRLASMKHDPSKRLTRAQHIAIIDSAFA